MKKHLLICLLLCLSHFSFSQDGDSITLTKKPGVEIDASFPGGIPAWSAYVSNAMNKKQKQLRKTGEQGTVMILFVIDKNGMATNIRALDCATAGVARCLPPGSKLAEIAIEIIANSPPWNPATINGKPVKAYRRQPISYILQ